MQVGLKILAVLPGKTDETGAAEGLADLFAAQGQNVGCQ
jgi:hypothetical protein